MKKMIDTSRLRNPWRIVGMGILAFFGVKLLLCMHLTVVGQVAPGYTGRVELQEMRPLDTPVLYVYHVGQRTHHGWRRGIEWGAQEVSIVYSPVFPRYHFVTTVPRLRSAIRLWGQADYILRVLLLAAAAAIGLALTIWAEKMPRGMFLPGLHNGMDG